MASKPGPSDLPAGVGVSSEPQDHGDNAHNDPSKHDTLADTAAAIAATLTGDGVEEAPQNTAASQSRARLPLLSSIYNRILAFVPKIGTGPATTDGTDDSTGATAKAEDPPKASAEDATAASDDEDEEASEAESSSASASSASDDEAEDAEAVVEASLTRLDATSSALQASIANLVQVVEEQQPATDDSESDSAEDDDEDSSDEDAAEVEQGAARKRRRVGMGESHGRGRHARSNNEVRDSESDSESDEEESGGAAKGRKRKR